MYDTVIFDLDGTLLDTLDDLTNAVNFSLEEYGFAPRTKAEVRSFVGNGILVLMKKALPENIDEEKFNEIFTFFKEYYTSNCRIKTKPYDGIMELLKYLKANNYKMAIVSNKNDEAVKDLTEYYFEDFISISVGQRDGIRRKPAPDTVNEAIAELHSDKENTIYVGDSEVDKETCDNAHIKCALVDWGFRDRDKLLELKSDYVISSPEELITII